MRIIFLITLLFIFGNMSAAILRVWPGIADVPMKYNMPNGLNDSVLEIEISRLLIENGINDSFILTNYNLKEDSSFNDSDDAIKKFIFNDYYLLHEFIQWQSFDNIFLLDSILSLEPCERYVFRDDLPNGKWSLYAHDLSGYHLLYQKEVKDHLLSGAYHDKDDRGTGYCLGQFIQGKRIGPLFIANGQGANIHKILYNSCGIIQEETEYSSEGRIIKFRSASLGIFVMFYDDGHVFRFSEWKDDNFFGLNFILDENGNILSSEKYKD